MVQNANVFYALELAGFGCACDLSEGVLNFFPTLPQFHRSPVYIWYTSSTPGWCRPCSVASYVGTGFCKSSAVKGFGHNAVRSKWHALSMAHRHSQSIVIVH